MQFKLSNGTVAPFYLAVENDRNTRHGLVYMEVIRRAFEVDEVVMVGHHFVFEPKPAMEALDLTRLNEIPSADMVLFDDLIMDAVFGRVESLRIRAELAVLARGTGEREEKMRVELARLPALATEAPETRTCECRTGGAT